MSDDAGVQRPTSVAASPLLRLALDPIVPLRAPASDQWLGYRLRLPDGGPLIAEHDAILAAFGAVAGSLFVRDELEEALQDDAFAPGRELQLELEPFDPDDPDLVTAWSADGAVQAGELHDPLAKQVRAGIDAGLHYRAVVLAERRAVVDDRREGLDVLVLPTAFVELGPAPPALRPPAARPVRRRIVLVAGRDGDLRWWEAAVNGGPLSLDDLPFTPSFRERFERVADELVERAEQLAGGLDDPGFDHVIQGLEAEALREEVDDLWSCARAELGTRFLAGCRLPGRRVRWTDDEPEYGPDDLPF